MKNDKEKRLGFLFDQLFAVSGLMCRDDFFCKFVGRIVAVRELHRIRGTPSCLGDKVVGVSQHFRERYLRLDDHVVAAFSIGDDFFS